MLLTAALDDRAGPGKIASRIGLSAEAHIFDRDSNLLAQVLPAHQASPLACLLVDEAQFLTPEQVWQLSVLADAYNLPVMCYGLRTDFQGFTVLGIDLEMSFTSWLLGGSGLNEFLNVKPGSKIPGKQEALIFFMK